MLIVEGPGQTGFLRFHPDVSFRPDYEVPVGAMIDYALSRDDVDPQRLAVYGISFGGYFASRAVAHDRRIKALVANSPIPDLYAYMIGFVGPEMAANPPPLTIEEIDRIPAGTKTSGAERDSRAMHVAGSHSSGGASSRRWLP